MEFEVSVKRTYNIKLADADLKRYWVNEPPKYITSKLADDIRDRRTDSLKAIVQLLRIKAEWGDQQGVLTVYDDLFQDDEELHNEIAAGLADPHGYWCLHFETDLVEEDC